MILTYQQCIEIYGSDYSIKKMIKNGKLYQQGKGIYSDKQFCSMLDVIAAKYPQAVFSGRSAYYYHGLTDEIPEKYYISTKRSATRIKNSKIKQSFASDDIYDFGIETIRYQGSDIRIYSKERLLVDLIRFRAKYPMDFYKGVIRAYRQITEELDYFDIEEYAEHFSNGEDIIWAIQLEVL